MKYVRLMERVWLRDEVVVSLRAGLLRARLRAVAMAVRVARERGRWLATVLSLSLCLWLARPVAAHDGPVDIEQIRFDQRLGERVPLDLKFRNEAGELKSLREFTQGKPIVLTLNYFHCPNLCTLILEDVAEAAADSGLPLGEAFEIVTVSIDSRETPELATGQKSVLVRHYAGKLNAAEGWHFLTGDEQSITQLAEAVGFRYAYDPERDEFAHPAGMIVLTPEGRITHYLFGLGYQGRDLRLALVEAAQNQIGDWADQVLLRCYHYDPENGRYSLTVLTATRVAGALTVAGIGLGLFVLWRREFVNN